MRQHGWLKLNCAGLLQASVAQMVLRQTIVSRADAEQRPISDVTKIPVLPARRFQLLMTRLAAQCDFETTAGQSRSHLEKQPEYFSAILAGLSCALVTPAVVC